MARKTMESRKRVRIEDEEDDDMEFIILIVGFIIVLVGALNHHRYKVRELVWNEPESEVEVEVNSGEASCADMFSEHWDEGGATLMDEEACDDDGTSSSIDTTCGSSSKKRSKEGKLAEAVSSLAHSLKIYVEARLKATPPTFGGKQVYDEVSKVDGILRPQILEAVSVFVETPIRFQVLTELPDDQKLDWILLCLDERDSDRAPGRPRV